MSDHFIVKLKADNRWLTPGREWAVSKPNAQRFVTRIQAHTVASMADSAAYGAGLVTVVRVKRAKRKTTPVAHHVLVLDWGYGSAVCVNGIQIGTGEERASAERRAKDLRRALGIKEEGE